MLECGDHAQEISPLSITACAEGRHTLCMWGRKHRRNCRRKSLWLLLKIFGVESGALDNRWLKRDIVFGVGSYSGMTWDSRTSEVEWPLVWKLTLVWSRVIPREYGVVEVLEKTGSYERLSGRFLVTWTRVIILMMVNFLPLQQSSQKLFQVPLHGEVAPSLPLQIYILITRGY